MCLRIPGCDPTVAGTSVHVVTDLVRLFACASLDVAPAEEVEVKEGVCAPGLTAEYVRECLGMRVNENSWLSFK